jgi:hypothetical protein
VVGLFGVHGSGGENKNQKLEGLKTSWKPVRFEKSKIKKKLKT